MGKFYSIKKIRAQSGSNVGRIDIYGEISATEFWGDEKTPSQFIKELNDLGPVSEIEVHIFSPGGDPFAALAIYSEMKRRTETINVYIDGIAASAATLILCAGDKVFMNETAMLMVHNPYQILCFSSLNADDARELAEELDKIREPMILAYAKKSGKSREEVIALMDGEKGSGTWLTAEEAIDFGLADEYTPEGKQPLEAAACISPGVFNYRGHKIDLTGFDKAAEKTAGIINSNRGGNNSMGNPIGKILNLGKKPKPAAKVKPKAEVVFVEMVCPSCNNIVNLNPDTGEVFAGGAGQAEPQSDGNSETPLARRMPSNVRAALYNVNCPHCGNDFAWDTDVNADGEDGQATTEAVPLGTAGADGAGKSGETSAPSQTGAAPASAPAPAAKTQTKPKAQVKPKAELAQSVCPNCGAELTFDTEQTEKGNDAAGTEGYLITCPECNTEYVEPLAAPEPTAIPVGTNAQAAYRMGVRAERERILALQEMSEAAPGVGNMIAAAIRTGASVAAMSRNVFKALAKNPNIKAAQYLQAIGRDSEASGVNNLRTPQHHNKQASYTENVFEILNNR
jgi:ATP-dependent Clp protease protease subunit